MIKDILEAYQQTQSSKEPPKYVCKYCNKGFVKETTLTNHACERKRRYQQQNERAVQWGLMAYLEFYNITQNGKTKNYDDFVDSPYYTAFVKFGRYCVDVKCINFLNFTSWLLKNNKKIDYWTSDRLYEEWLYKYLQTENVQDALERGLKEMTEYASANPDLKNGFTDYFRYGNTNKICYHISTGRISPWIIFNSKSGIEFLESLTEDQAAIVLQWLDPEFWQLKFKNSKEDVEWARKILTTAGL